MMFANAFGVKKRHSDEAEKPFWISYADLMTAMMVLFFVVMVASLSSVTQRIQRAEQGEKTRDRISPDYVNAWNCMLAA